MKVLIADQFEQTGIDGITAAGCEVIYQPALADEQLAGALASTKADVLVVRSTKVTDAMLANGSLSLGLRTTSLPLLSMPLIGGTSSGDGK